MTRSFTLERSEVKSRVYSGGLRLSMMIFRLDERELHLQRFGSLDYMLRTRFLANRRAVLLTQEADLENNMECCPEDASGGLLSAGHRPEGHCDIGFSQANDRLSTRDKMGSDRSHPPRGAESLQSASFEITKTVWMLLTCSVDSSFSYYLVSQHDEGSHLWCWRRRLRVRLYLAQSRSHSNRRV